MSGVRAAQKAVLRLRTTFLLICLATLWWPGLTFAVPAGTVINNTAQVSYDINTAHYNLTSNTEQFTVDSTLSPDLGNMAVAGQNSNHYYPGSSASLDISIDNTGGNSLDNGFITIDTDPDINVELNGANVSLVTESTSESGKRKKYSVSDLAQASSVTYQAQVDLPLTAAARSASMKVTYEANDKQIYSEDITLNISARSSGTLKLMQYSTASDADATAVMPSAYLDSNNTYQPIPAPQLIQAPGLDVTAPVSVDRYCCCRRHRGHAERIPRQQQYLSTDTGAATDSGTWAGRHGQSRTAERERHLQPRPGDLHCAG